MNRTIPFSIGFVLALSAGPSILVAAPSSRPDNAYQLYLRGLLLESQGNYISALEDMEKAIEASPNSSFLHRTAAELCIKLGQINRANDFILKATDFSPNDVQALLLEGQIAWTMGDSERAEARLQKAQSIDPDNPDVLISLAGALSPKKPEEAVKLYRSFLSRHPGEVNIMERLAQLYQSMGSGDKAQSTWKDILSFSPNSMRAHLALAQIAEVNFDTYTAISHYQSVLEEDPTNLPLLLRVGELRYRNDEMAQALEAFTKAQKLGPDSASANFWLALMAERKGDWKEAIRLLKQVSLTTHEPGVMLRLSYYYSQVGRHREAVEALERLSASDPTNLDFLNYLAVAYEQDHQNSKAEKTLQMIIEKDPQNPEPRFELATLLDRTGRFPKAELELKKLIEIKPTFHMALNYLGYSYAEKNIHLNDAENLLMQALILAPNNPAYLDSMGWVYYRLGKYQRAEDFLQEAVAKTQDPLIWEHLGDVLKAKGELTGAILAWEASFRGLAPQPKLGAKLKRALREMPPRDRFFLNVKRVVSHFQEIQSIKGKIIIKVLEKPANTFNNEAEFTYTVEDGLRVEIPGPTSEPVFLLTKKKGQAIKYGAMHPLFQSVEYYVTRAFERINGLVAGSLFDNADLEGLRSAAIVKNGKLSAATSAMEVVFNDADGLFERVASQSSTESDSLRVGRYGMSRLETLPSFIEWTDELKKVVIRLEFVNPAFSFEHEQKTAGADDDDEKSHP